MNKRIVVDYNKEIAEYRRRNLIFLGVVLGAVIGVPLSLSLKLEAIARVLEFGSIFAFMLVSLWRLEWRCPRCERRFYYKWWYSNVLATKCVHCGFRPSSPGESAGQF